MKNLKMTHTGHQGFTLIELCVAAVLVVFVGIASTVLLRNAVEARMEKTVLKEEAGLGLAIMTRLRQDMDRAVEIKIKNSGKQLAIGFSPTESAIWDYVPGAAMVENTIRRTYENFPSVPATTEDFVENRTWGVHYYVSCDAPCFTGFTEAGAAASSTNDAPPNTMRRIEVNNLVVGHDSLSTSYAREVDTNHGGASQFSTEKMVFRFKNYVRFQ